MGRAPHQATLGIEGERPSARERFARAQDPKPAVGFEEAVEQLEAIIERMERGEIALEDSLREYARGDSLVRRCRQACAWASSSAEKVTPRASARRRRTGASRSRFRSAHRTCAAPGDRRRRR
ncbi:MAG: exodeoxyribonuclease VII small subunit [Phycisphaerales bacterium]